MTDDIALKAIMAAAEQLWIEPRCEQGDAARAELTATVQDALAYAGVMRKIAAMRDAHLVVLHEERQQAAYLLAQSITDTEAEAATLREKLVQP